MEARSPARYLAPIALLAAAVAIVIVIAGAGHSASAPAPAPAPARTVTSPILTTRGHHARRARAYVVKAGDSLSSISAATGVPVATLEALNPGVNPAALQTGQRLTLRR